MFIMDTSGKNREPGSNLVLWLALAVCLASVVGSSLLYFFWTPQRYVNYGELLEPVALASTSVEQIDGRSFNFSDLKGRWILLSVDDSVCNEQCRRKLYLMRQIRLTQGNSAERIERVRLIDNAKHASAEVSAVYRGTREVVVSGLALLNKFPGGENRSDYIYVMDPLGNLMMRYRHDVEPNLMKKDISKLLRLSSGWRQVQRRGADTNE
jgi:hypothetical protein